MKPRPAARRALMASRRAEERYVRDLRSILGRVHEGVHEVVGFSPNRPKTSPEAPPSARHDEDSAGPNCSQTVPRVRDEDPLGGRFLKRLFTYVRKETAKAYDRMAGVVRKKNAAGAALLGVTPHEAGIGGIVEQARERNIQLVTSAAQGYVEQVRAVLADPDNLGLRVEDLADELEERANVSQSRAELIARDQTLKLNGAITKHRQVAAGVERYTWSTSLDERVRPGHADLEGEMFSWDDPPDTGDGEHCHPGEDFQCRCIADPVIEEAAAEEPEEKGESFEQAAE